MRVAHRRVWLAVLLALLVLGCHIQTTPQAAVAHYGTTILEAVTLYQGVVINANQQGMITTDTALPLMNAIRATLVTAGHLSDALKAYDAAPTGANETAVRTLITQVSQESGHIATDSPPQLTAAVTTMNASLAPALAAIAGATVFQAKD